ncbi:hypothetical protein HDU67_004663, partial [Dinochytrium kinnereticum]
MPPRKKQPQKNRVLEAPAVNTKPGPRFKTPFLKPPQQNTAPAIPNKDEPTKKRKQSSETTHPPRFKPFKPSLLAGVNPLQGSVKLGTDSRAPDDDASEMVVLETLEERKENPSSLSPLILPIRHRVKIKPLLLAFSRLDIISLGR